MLPLVLVPSHSSLSHALQRMARLIEQRQDLEEKLKRRDYRTEHVDTLMDQRETEFQIERD